MNVKTEALVLRNVKYGDSRLIVDLFTREQGRIAFAVTVTKSAKGKMKKQFFQPMTLIEVDFDFRPQADLQRLKDVRLSVAYASLTVEPVKLAQSLFVAEFLFYALRSEQRNVPLFDYVADSMQWLDMAMEGYANFHLTFMIRLSRFLGFYPNLDDYVPGCIFDLRASCFTLTYPIHQDFLSVEESARMHLVMRIDYPTMRLFRMTRSDRNRITAILLKYYQIHIPDFPDMKSLEVLQELFV